MGSLIATRRIRLMLYPDSLVRRHAKIKWLVSPRDGSNMATTRRPKKRGSNGLSPCHCAAQQRWHEGHGSPISGVSLPMSRACQLPASSIFSRYTQLWPKQTNSPLRQSPTERNLFPTRPIRDRTRPISIGRETLRQSQALPTVIEVKNTRTRTSHDNTDEP